jgi:Zn-dependent protease/CBS domain-containing protein
MGKGFKLFKILGIQISIDYTWFIVFVFFAWTLAYGYYPYMNPGLERPVYIAMGVFSSLALFACVLIHELSHSYTSNRLGLEVRRITLFIFGGVAELSREPDKATDELKVAIAGPIASMVLAALFWALAKLFTDAAYPVPHAVLSYLALLNIVLVIFNMIPGFPLDGGRVLRSIWWWRTGDIDQATRVTSQIGKGFAMVLIILGFMRMITGNLIGGLWSVLIGVFLQQAAESGYQQVAIKQALTGMKVRDVMTTGVVSISDTLSIAVAVDKFFLAEHFVSFPVTSALKDGAVVGLLTLNSVRSVARDEWETTSVRAAMHTLEPGDILHPDDDAGDVLEKMTGDNLGRFPVLEGGALAGIVTRQDIMKVMQFKQEFRR